MTQTPTLTPIPTLTSPPAPDPYSDPDPRVQNTPGLGENLYEVYGPAGSLPPENQVIADAVAAWYAEIEYYNYSNPGTALPPVALSG